MAYVGRPHVSLSGIDPGLDSISNLTTAADKMIYTTGADTYAVTPITAFGRSILDDADAAAVRTTLGLGTSSTVDTGTTANKILQLDSNAKIPAVDGSQLTNLPASGGSYEATASGSIGNGKPVIVNADGTLSEVALNSVSEAIGSFVNLDGTNSSSNPAVVYDPDSKKVIAFWCKGADNKGYYAVGTINNLTVTFGSAATFTGGSRNLSASYGISACMDTTLNRVVVIYLDAASSNSLYSNIGTINANNTITWHGEATVHGDQTQYPHVSYDSDTQRVVAAYIDQGNSYYPKAQVGTPQATSLTWGGSEYQMGTLAGNHLASAFDVSARRTLIGANTSGFKMFSGIINNSNNSMSFGSAGVYNWTVSGASMAYDSANEQVIVSVVQSGFGKAFTVRSTTGGTLTVGTVASFPSHSISDTNLAFDTFNNIAIASAWASSWNYAYKITPSGTNNANLTITTTSLAGGNTAIQTSQTFDSAIAYDSNQRRFVALLRDGNPNVQAKAAAFTVAQNEPNLTTENFIGFNTGGAKTNGQTVTVNTVGSVDTNQSSLTPGQTYYIQNNATIATTPASPSVIAGTAVAATKLIVKG